MRDGSEIIRCYRCGEGKPAEDFNWRRRHRDQRDSFCRPCRAAYKQEHYRANKERYIARAKATQSRLREERTRFLLDYFIEHPCTDCGESDPLVLEFDHLRDKCFDIAQAISYRNWESILAEIEKCEVVCANCHRRRTVTRSGSVRLRLLAEADDQNRTGTERMETSHAAFTPRPQGPEDGSSGSP